MTCKDYLKSSNFTTLTISNILTLNDIQTKVMYNLYINSILSSNNPIFVRMGSVPVLKYKSISSALFPFSSLIDPSPDYTFQTINSAFTSNMNISNISKLNVKVNNQSVTNIFIKFEYNSNVFAVTSYNISYTYKSFGSFPFRVFTQFGSNDLITTRSIINIQSIQYYPFTSLAVNKFDLNCSLNGLNLNCFINLNISNFGQSNQLITVDFGDGSFQDIEVNTYCK